MLTCRLLGPHLAKPGARGLQNRLTIDENAQLADFLRGGTMVAVSRTVLFVDDNSDLRHMAAASLRRYGYDVVTASDGLEALGALQDRDFDLAVVDIIMPHKEGLGTIMEMRALRPAMPIIAISGGGDINADGLTRLGEIVGADHALAKPFTPSRLSALIEKACAEAVH